MDKKVLLVVMPWSNPTLPSLALGLLKSILERDGIGCDTLHGNVLGYRLLDRNGSYDLLSTEMASELIFTPLYFGTDRRETAAGLACALTDSAVAAGKTPAYYLELMDRAEAFINALFAATDWEQYDIIGFSLTFQETLASLCLARKIKELDPHKRIIFGGAACDGEMGLEMVRAFPEVDYAVVGEADATVTEIVRAIRSHRDTGVPAYPMPGLVYRDSDDRVVYTGPVPVFAALDTLPAPDFGDYFAQLEQFGATEIRPRLYLETSRGCWYGEKQACSFCGLGSFTFRRKSPQRALREMVELSSRHRIPDFYMSDNILDYQYFDTFLPELARLRHGQGMDFTVFYEVKSNLKRPQVQALAAAGVRMVQIGIESFNDHVLTLMNKGTTTIQQIQSLKYLTEYEITAVWNIIYANPGEQPSDYLEMARIIPFMHHLPAPHPGQAGPMVLQRFSRYWTDPGKYGIRNVRPQAVYRQIYPTDGIDHSRLACFFEYDLPQLQEPQLLQARQVLDAALDEWREAYRPDLLTYRRGPGFVQITDRRPGRNGHRVVTLRGLQEEIFAFCDGVQAEKRILETFGDRASAEQLQAFLGAMVEQRFMYRSAGGQYLSLPLHRRG